MNKFTYKKLITCIISVITCLALVGCSFSNKSENTTVDYPISYMDYDSFATLLGRHNIRFGTVVNGYTVNDKNLQRLINKHFNSITAANEMKAYSMLDQRKSQQSSNQMPVMNYEMADTIMQFAMDNNIGVRGHVLVWDAYMVDWFFREGYKSDGEFVDRETMLKRLEYYITEVITHFETLFPGVIYCWDVVNEAVGDNADEYDMRDMRHLRTVRSGEPNLFRECIGDDYVEISFLYARNAVEACKSDVKLFYNDYNTFHEEKCAAICELVTSINSYDTKGNRARKLCDGVGMQGYIGGYGVQEGCLETSDINRIRKAINAFAALDVEVHLTEMAVRNFEPDETYVKKHAEFYRDLFTMLVQINRDGYNPLTSISIWSIFDNDGYQKGTYNYNLNSPYGGLFTEDYKVKEAFYNVYHVLKK